MLMAIGSQKMGTTNHAALVKTCSIALFNTTGDSMLDFYPLPRDNQVQRAEQTQQDDAAGELAAGNMLY